MIPNGRTLAMYDGTGPADIGSREKVLAFVGDLGPRKNQKFLVDVMNHLPDVYRLLLIGHDVDHHYRREIDAAIGPHLRGRVILPAAWITRRSRPSSPARTSGFPRP